ncbi:hypothetical protein C8F04DRAFT_1387826 [Mycena alexandri]|uniref:NAD(P)-binding protein n=1 Tax=Mycena alexandri TaxID=1745969 RepID=A0AAD6XFF0_9AGAR|nr:hypothetical protein C8F04DRAFT_1387826 [Mycena alexandri]
MAHPLRSYLLLTLAIAPILAFLHSRRSKRSNKLPRKNERVLIIGASSGIGRTLAHQYAKLGVKGVCIVGRRGDMVAEVVAECKELSGNTETEIVGFVGDFAEPGDMVEARTRVEAVWGGLDTLIVAAGVSALRPLMDVAGATASTSNSNVEKAAIEHVVDVAAAATRGNYVGPLVAAVAFIPLLQSTSGRPAVLLVNSLASAIPAPTRAIYASTKASSLHLYQSLAIEHPKIAFTLFMPGTVEGDFRKGAVDARVFRAPGADGSGGITVDGMSAVREADPNKYGLKRDAVAERCLQAIERGEKNVFQPWTMAWGHLLYWVWPGYVEGRASVKYNFTPGA